MVIAVLIGVFCGVTKLGLPLEDALTGIRTSLRYEVAAGDIVMVKLDDRTLDELGKTDAPRDLDAVLIDKLVAAGAKRIILDRSYSFLEDPEEDRILVEALKAHPGKVYMGAMYAEKEKPTGEVSLVPAPIFRKYSGVASLVGFVHPFRLSASFPFKSETTLGTVPSMSALLADLDELPDGMFRPDYAIDIETIPHFSYIDVIRDKAPDSAFRGRDVVVGLTAVGFHDYHFMPSQGYVPGAYFHVVAAQTLKQGVPLNLGWLAPFLLVIGLIITGIGRGRAIDMYRIAGVVAILVFIPFILDAHGVHVEIIPAVVTAGLAIFRGRALDREEKAGNTNAGSGLPSVQALKEIAEVPRGILIALKIRNYGAITSSFAQPVESKLAGEIVRRIQISDPDSVVYHEGDMYFWISALSNPLDVLENLEGLHLIMQNRLRIDDRDIDLSFNCGVESDVDRAIGSRLASAKQCAEEAVRKDEIVQHYDGDGRESQWEVSLLSSLDRAIDDGEVWVAYQPKLDLRSGRIKGAEALVRWTHPERGSIAPEQFIKLAEEYHRIERITRFVLNDAVRSAATLVRDGYDFSVSVNISAKLLRNAGLPNMIFEALDANKLAPERLILEITETDRLDRSSKTFEMIKELVEAGLQLSIDDFGTGNATIDYLRYLPASEVKIDMVFVKDMETNREDLLLVQSIIDMAHSLDRRVVAEGVESDAIIEKLRAMDCDQVQGFVVSRPVSIAEIVPILQNAPLRLNG